MVDNTIISIRDVVKRFGSSVLAVNNVSLDIKQGEFFALLGPSGCGKTTLLRILAGFETPSEGQVLIDGDDMERVEPNKRPVNMVFQSYAVFPHMTVRQNVAYGLRVVGTPKPEIDQRVQESLSLVQLEELADRKPDELSGGQRQRVALARALVKHPKVLLLDEPLSALDAKLREQMQIELVHLQQTVGITFVIVTHDQNEALSMADRVAVMNGGNVLQVASPTELYEYPNCRFVADFIGKMNLFDGQVVGVKEGQVVVRADAITAHIGDISVPFGDEARGKVGIAIRPEKVKLDGEEPKDMPIRVRAKVVEVVYYGNESHVFLQSTSGAKITANIKNTSRNTHAGIVKGDQLWVSWCPQDTLVLTS
ncbi:MAG: ABC transporter ATP-binding protein [Gammaproteobacteria bacterium]|nr:ABC transporter ATP-binding protein [Gammaproteobacteria bacterium]